MYAIVEPGTTGQRVLSPDDIAGLCAIYAAARDPKTCSLDLPDDGCGCTAGGSGPRRAGAGAVLFVGAWASVARRRSRRRSETPL